MPVRLRRRGLGIMSRMARTCSRPSAAADELRYVDVSVATVWSSPSAPRAIDRPALGDPVDLQAWTGSLDTAARLGLIGRTETQVLFGEPVRVLERRSAWTRIAVPNQPSPRDPRGYPGWVPATHLHASPDFGRLLSGSVAIVSAPTAGLRGLPGAPELSFGTRLPVLGQVADEVVVATPSGRRGRLPATDVRVYASASAIPRPTGRAIVAAARTFLGLRYLWGGTSAFGFDCSGLAHLVYRENGLVIPRDSEPQARQGQPVERAELAPGDLVFFATDPPSRAVTHTAIWIGEERILEAPSSAGAVHIIPVARRGDQYVTARRYVPTG